jgi:site-specific DNA-cytosine methylase
LKNKFTFIELFAGIGGFHLAMHRLGGEFVFASEIDDFARQTYEANYQKIPAPPPQSVPTLRNIKLYIIYAAFEKNYKNERSPKS